MKKFLMGILWIHLFSGSVWARLPKTVPLLPPRDSGSGLGNMRNKTVNPKPYSSNPITFGIEVGTLLRNDSTSSDLIGMQLFYGGRASVDVSVIAPAFHLKPSLGYFRKQQAEGAVSVTQHVIEGGVNLLYEVLSQQNFQWSLGAAGRVDYLMSTISVYNQSDRGSSFRFRGGPSSGIKFQLSENLKFTTDFECTFAVSRPIRVFGGFTTGLAFDL